MELLAVSLILPSLSVTPGLTPSPSPHSPAYLSDKLSWAGGGGRGEHASTPI